MKYLLIIIGLFFVQIQSQAQTKTSTGLQICYTGQSSTDILGPARETQMNFDVSEMQREFQLYKMSQVSCLKLKKVTNGLTTLATGLSIGAGIATLSGWGIPVSVGFSIGAGAVSYANFLITGIDCKEDDPAFKEKVKVSVCEMLENSDIGIKCDSNNIPVRDLRSHGPMCTNENGDISL